MTGTVNATVETQETVAWWQIIEKLNPFIYIQGPVQL